MKFNLKYKNRPLLRSQDTIFYGNPKDKYMLKLSIFSHIKLGDIKIANKVSVQIIITGTDVVIKSAERDNLYSALDLGEFWLSEILEGNN